MKTFMQKSRKFLPALFLIASTAHADSIRSWVNLDNFETAGRYDDIVFTPDMTGFAINANGQIYRSQNQGQTWSPLFRDQGVYMRTIDFLDNNRTGFVGALRRDKFYRTTDGGATWTNISDKLPGHHSICGLDHIGAKVFAVGNYQVTSAQLFRSLDSGENWELINLNSLASGLIDVKFLTPTVGFISGTHSEKGAVILKTTDGGTTWAQVYPAPNATTYPTRASDILWKLDFVNERVGYGSVYSNTDSVTKIVKTTDGGNTWQTIVADASKNWQLEAIGFLDENTGWAGGYGNGTLMTTDGGQTWSTREDGGNLNRIYFIRPDTGFAAGGGIFSLSEGSARSPASVKPAKTNYVVPHKSVVKNSSGICVELDRDTHVTVRTLDKNGGFIDNKGKNNFALAHAPMTKGEHCFDPKTSYKLKDGIYYVQFRTNERIFAQKFKLKANNYLTVK